MDYTDWKVEIKTPKQDNGIWGMPLQCIEIDRIPMNMTESNWLKRSAICMDIAEHYPDETFKIFFLDENKFMVQLSKTGLIRIHLDNYELVGNTLTWIK